MAFLTFRMQGTPPGLERLLCGFHRKNNETGEQARRCFFRRVFSILSVRTFVISPLISTRYFDAVLTFLLPFLPLFRAYGRDNARCQSSTRQFCMWFMFFMNPSFHVQRKYNAQIQSQA